MNVIALLKDDHRTVSALFLCFEQLGPRASPTKRRIVDQVIRELAMNAAIKEQILYPAVRRWLPAWENHVLDSLEKHQVLMWTLSELALLDVGATMFDAQVNVLMERVRAHIGQEEDGLFPAMEHAVPGRDLVALAQAIEWAKTAPLARTRLWRGPLPRRAGALATA
jgi:hypothetical protein